jgi:methylated-DNA-[protein]-cysteine S-methyltransferase
MAMTSEADDICVLDSPVGRLRAELADGVLRRLRWTSQPLRAPRTPAAEAVAKQLAEYFAGRRRSFDLPVETAGTEHQRAVWAYMTAIPYGETRSYGQCAAAIGGNPREVGQACGANPVPIIIPCHRILAADGLGGYSGQGGLQTKRALLALEGVRLPAEQLALPL